MVFAPDLTGAACRCRVAEQVGDLLVARPGEIADRSRPARAARTARAITSWRRRVVAARAGEVA